MYRKFKKKRLIALLICVLFSVINIAPIQAAIPDLDKDSLSDGQVIIGKYYFDYRPEITEIMEASKTIPSGTSNNKYYFSEWNEEDLAWYDAYANGSKVYLTDEEFNEIFSNLSLRGGEDAPIVNETPVVQASGSENTVYADSIWTINADATDATLTLLEGWKVDHIYGGIGISSENDETVIKVVDSTDAFSTLVRVKLDTTPVTAYIGIDKLGDEQGQSVLVESITLVNTDDQKVESINGLLLSATVEPDAADNQALAWSVKPVVDPTGDKKPGAATINQEGLLQPVKNGWVTVTAAAMDGSGAFDTIDVEIKTFAESIAVTVKNSSPATITTSGGSLELTYTIEPADLKNPPDVLWAVVSDAADPGKAAISKTGQLTAVADGKVTVWAIATDGSGVMGSLDVTIDIEDEQTTDKLKKPQITLARYTSGAALASGASLVVSGGSLQAFTPKTTSGSGLIFQITDSENVVGQVGEYEVKIYNSSNAISTTVIVGNSDWTTGNNETTATVVVPLEGTSIIEDQSYRATVQAKAPTDGSTQNVEDSDVSDLSAEAQAGAKDENWN